MDIIKKDERLNLKEQHLSMIHLLNNFFMDTNLKQIEHQDINNVSFYFLKKIINIIDNYIPIFNIEQKIDNINNEINNEINDEINNEKKQILKDYIENKKIKINNFNYDGIFNFDEYEKYLIESGEFKDDKLIKMENNKLTSNIKYDISIEELLKDNFSIKLLNAMDYLCVEQKLISLLCEFEKNIIEKIMLKKDYIIRLRIKFRILEHNFSEIEINNLKNDYPEYCDDIEKNIKLLIL